MLVSLHIENIAVIKCVDIDFAGGFTALTGETGAGKSILIDSIGFLLGARSSRELLRTGEDKALVSAMFCGFDSETIRLLADNDAAPDEDGNLLLSRTMNADGRTQSKINGRAVVSSTVRAIAPLLVNIHGQNDSLRFLEDENHILFLDAYARNEKERNAYNVAFGTYKNAQKRWKELQTLGEVRAKREADLRHTIKLLEAAKVKEGEEEKLLAEKKIVANAEKVSKQTAFVYRALKDAEKANAAYILDRCAVALSQLADTVPEATELVVRLKNLQYEVEDIAETVYDLGDIGDAPGERLDRLESRIASLQKLKKHFGTDEAGLIALLSSAKEELSSLEQFEDTLFKAQADCLGAKDAAQAAAAVLTETRRSAAQKLIPLVLAELEFLDMEKVVFDISVMPLDVLGADGSDRVQFLISANKGEEPRPLSKIASGGELARIMLAVKTVFAEAFGVHTVIYDEIDTGVSGKTARKIGIKLKQSARGTQTVCVTHSAQIASLADAHLLIRKNTVGERTETTVVPIEGDARVGEIARILGGVTVSDNMLISAKELIDEGRRN